MQQGRTSNLTTSELGSPAGDTLEISLFGPGYGESIAIHLGRGDWIIVDSCVTGRNRTPAALEYLNSIGVDPATAVKLVVATHWHDDHIRGLAELYRACRLAVFTCSQALQHEDLVTLAVMANDRPMMENSGMGEFFSVLKEVGRRNMPMRWAMADRPLWRRDGSIPCEVRALSPSDQVVTRGFKSVGQLITGGKVPKKRIMAPERNHGAVAIWIKVGSNTILLGADLLSSRTNDEGWGAVLASPHRDGGPAKVYKIAHHGAASADEPRIWSALLVDQPIAILTPFVRGNRALPTNRDIQRLRGQTDHVFATARNASTVTTFEKGPVGRTKREVLLSSRRLSTEAGHVRVRMSLDEPHGRVDLFGDAVPLSRAEAGAF